MTDIWQQVRGAYADEGLALPGEDLPARARRRRQRMTVAGVAAGVLAVTAGTAVALGIGGGTAPAQFQFAAPNDDPSGLRIDTADYLADEEPPWESFCRERAGHDEYDDLAAMGWPDPFEPAAVFNLADDRQWFTFLASPEAGFGCYAEHRLSFDQATFHRSNVSTQPGEWLMGSTTLPAFQHNTDGSAMNSQSMLVGLATAGTESVEVVLTDGTVVAAVLDGQWFIAWLPVATGQTFLGTIDEVVGYDDDGARIWVAEDPHPVAEEPAGN